MATKIYTKTGDAGTTGLFGGERRSKDDIRIEAYGAIDELNAFIGVLAVSVRQAHVKEELQQIQSRLFDLGAHFATMPGKDMPLPELQESMIEDLEQAIDRMQLSLAPLKHFILPGGHKSAAEAHVCRTVCRRAERSGVALSSVEGGHEFEIKYLNRLSDYLFVLSRWLTDEDGATEVKWLPVIKKQERS